MRDWLLKATLVGIAAGLSAFASTAVVGTTGVHAGQTFCEFIEEETEGEEFCGLSIEKELVSDNLLDVGDIAEFEITVTNTGTVALTTIGVADEFDESLGFDDADLEPTFGPDSGLVVWDPVDSDDDGPDVLFAGESLTIFVEFDALSEDESADNCAQAFANVLLKKSSDGLTAQGDVPDISTEFACDDVEIGQDEDGGGSGGPDPFETPTDVPELPEPTSAPDTPPTAVPTQPGGDVGPGGIAPPDTGSGPGSGAAAGSPWWLLAGLAAAAMILSGAGIVAAKRSR